MCEIARTSLKRHHRIISVLGRWPMVHAAAMSRRCADPRVRALLECIGVKRARWTSSAEANRASGRFSRQRITTCSTCAGMSCCSERGGSGSLCSVVRPLAYRERCRLQTDDGRTASHRERLPGQGCRSGNRPFCRRSAPGTCGPVCQQSGLAQFRLKATAPHPRLNSRDPKIGSVRKPLAPRAPGGCGNPSFG